MLMRDVRCPQEPVVLPRRRRVEGVADERPRDEVVGPEDRDEVAARAVRPVILRGKEVVRAVVPDEMRVEERLMMVMQPCENARSPYTNVDIIIER